MELRYYISHTERQTWDTEGTHTRENEGLRPAPALANQRPGNGRSIYIDQSRASNFKPRRQRNYVIGHALAQRADVMR